MLYSDKPLETNAGNTPILTISKDRQPEICEDFDLRTFDVKDESVNPTGTFKDRIYAEIVLRTRHQIIRNAVNFVFHESFRPPEHVRPRDLMQDMESKTKVLAFEYSSGNAIRSLLWAIENYLQSDVSVYAIIEPGLDLQIKEAMKTICAGHKLKLSFVSSEFVDDILRMGLNFKHTIGGTHYMSLDNSAASIIFELIIDDKFPDHIFLPLGSGHLARAIIQASPLLYILRAFRKAIKENCSEEESKDIIKKVIRNLCVDTFTGQTRILTDAAGLEKAALSFFENLHKTDLDERVWQAAKDALNGRGKGYEYKPEIHMVSEIGSNGFLDPLLPRAPECVPRDTWTITEDALEYWSGEVYSTKPTFTKRGVVRGVADKLFVPELDFEVFKHGDIDAIFRHGNAMTPNPIHIHRVNGRDILEAWRTAVRAGIACEPSAATAFAGLKFANQIKELKGKILVINSGNGLYVNPDTGELHNPSK